MTEQDANGQLTLVTGENQQTLESYQYDANGNRETGNTAT